MALLVIAVMPMQIHAQPVAVISYGSCGVDLMQDGEVFLATGPTTCFGAQGAWSASGNVFVLSGRGSSRVAGMTGWGQILAVNGDWLWLNTGCPGTPEVSYHGNVFEIAGVSPRPGEEFTAFGYGGGLLEYAVTTVGNVYRWQGGGCSGSPPWTYVGSLPIGPTTARLGTWGRLKTQYR
jgi:hypothetical protein